MSMRETKKLATERPSRVAALGDQTLEAAHVGLGDLGVALQREDQGDVDRVALGNHVLDRGEPGLGGGDLDEQVGPITALCRRIASRKSASES